MPNYQSNFPQKAHLLTLRDRIVHHFDSGDWTEIGIRANCSGPITHHSRLLRSLNWNDPDYPGNVLQVLSHLYDTQPEAITKFEEFLDGKFPESADGLNISSGPSHAKKIVFNPTVFQVPEALPDGDLLSVMMPFDRAFERVYATIKAAAEESNMTCQRASDIWQHSTVMQDIFSLIYRSYIVVCDFTGKNPNVFYEAGIAHTLGKHVIPITQHQADIPFDLAHHRYLLYLNNTEGLLALKSGLVSRFWSLNRPF
jgi:hypothetical protein